LIQYVQLVVKTQQHLLHYIVQYDILHVSAYFRPSSGCICLALGVLYYDDNIKTILMMRSRSSYLMPYFYGGCIGSSIWMGSGLGCGMVAMD